MRELRVNHQSHQRAFHSQILVEQCVDQPDLEVHTEFELRHLQMFTST